MEGPPPPEIGERELTAALAQSWGLQVRGLRYEPKGYGSHHWVAVAGDGRRWFVKLDGLEGKPYLGEDPPAALDGLEAAYGTAHLLARAGLGFVVAPVPTLAGSILVPLGPRWTLAVFPFVDAVTGEWGRPGSGDQRRRLARTLAQLHAATRRAGPAVRSRGLDLPGRSGLEGALDEGDAAWSGGPFSEPARGALQANAALIREWLVTLDALALAVGRAGLEPVVTHGEPHPGNVMSAKEELRLIDWDTVALAPAERDLWMLAGDGGVRAEYEAGAGRALDAIALAFYRLTWALTDLALFTALLRGTHARNRSTEKAWTGLLSILDGSEPAPYGAGGQAR